MAREIKIVVDNNNTNPIFVVDGNIYVLCGDAAMITKLEDATPVERECAIGPNSDCDLARHIKDEYEKQNELAEAAAEQEQDEYVHSFDEAVDFLCRCSAEDFLELVKYSKKHDNTFFRCVKELTDVVNADDCYCTALIKMTRHLGEEVEKKAFELFHEAIEKEKDEYDFVQFWTALQTINYFCK